MTKLSGTILAGDSRPEGQGTGTAPCNDSSGWSTAGQQQRSTRGGSPARGWIVAGISIAALGAAWLATPAFYTFIRNLGGRKGA